MRTAHKLSIAAANSIPRFLAQNALVHFDERSITGDSGVTLANYGTGGADYDLDTNGGTAANRRRHPSGSALLFGADGDFISTPNSAANEFPNDITVIAKFKTGATTIRQTLVAQYAAGQYSFLFCFDGTAETGYVIISPAADASGAVSYEGFSALTAGSDGYYRVKFEFDSNNGASASAVTLFDAADDTLDWQQVGSPVTGAVVTAYTGSTESVKVGGLNNGSALFPLSGAISYVRMYAGIGGAATLRVDMDPTQYSSGTTFSSGGVTWTLNGNSFIQNTGYDTTRTIGSSYLETAAGQTIASPATVFIVAQFTNAAPGAVQVLFDSKSDLTLRWIFRTLESSSDQFNLYQEGAGITLSATYDTSLHVVTGQINSGATNTLTVSGLGSVSGAAGAQNWEFCTLFADRDGTLHFTGNFCEFIVLPTNPGASIITAINAYLANKWGAVT